MKCTIVICTHNRAPTLARALSSHEQTTVRRDDFEIVVVDNASTDNTRDTVERVALASSLAVRYVFEGRLGHSAALNTGIRAARGEVVAFTDDDALVEPRWLAALLAPFAEGADIVFGRVRPLWPAEPPAWYDHSVASMFAAVDYGDRSFDVTDEDHPFCGVNHAVRHRTLERLGGFTEALGAVGAAGGIGNDTDLFRRALRSGMRIRYEPEAAVDHLIPPVRCLRRHHVRQVLKGIPRQYAALVRDPPAVPRILGVPRFYYRLLLTHAVGVVRARRPGPRFRHELQALRFFALGLYSVLRLAAARTPVRAGEQS